MPNNPVQIVLNDEAFLRAPDPKQGGVDKDFFEGRDAEFVRHRERLLATIQTIERDVQRWPYGPLCYLRVRMRIEAIAKSYRPNRAIFLVDQFPCVGAGAPGELYFRAPLIHFARLQRHVAAAEDRGERRVSKTTGKPYHFVTRNRCEVGAIETIELAPSNMKRSFAADVAVAALSDSRAASGYIIELFEGQPLISTGDHDALGFQRSVATLQSVFREGGAGLFATLLPSPGGTPAIEMLLTRAHEPARIEDRRIVRSAEERIVTPAVLDLDVERHDAILRRLAEHPLVRQIRFPILIEPTESQGSDATLPFPTISRLPEGRYPKIGIIDTGVDGPLKTWVLDRHDFLDETDCDPTHGTLVAGVLIGARAANSPQLAAEEDGCDIVDVALMPRAPFGAVYGQRGFEAFLEELEAAITEAKERHGVRVFNMSLNVVSAVQADSYSLYAARLDDMQDRLGVLIVNSAGNLSSTEMRAPWPSKPAQVLAALAARTASDTIYMPSESVRTVAVGALNPPGSDHIVDAPATYTRRGPGLRVGVKPDVAHFGGTGKPGVTHLVSCSPTGEQQHTCGTSFAAPLVAKTLASLDMATGERLAPRTLRAFLIHNSAVPQPLSSPRLRDVARQFVGFGRPTSAATMLETEDHAITMVFESQLTAGERKPAILRFDFQWPASLVDPLTRACRGIVSMTLVYDAPIDQAFGTEFVRVNLSAHLRQRQSQNRKDGKPSFHDQVAQAFLPRTGKLTIPERSLIDHGLKWWPTKRYAADFTAGVGESAEWRLEVESVVRAEAVFPAEGIPFSLIITIEDENRSAPIFQTFRQSLLARRVDMQDVRTAIRVRAGRS
ncbi:S8 family peptidase [Bradyrhizobium sp. CCBAU 11361]|uniref:S8 family peptidase n=1 Tax=Bradyrhizobium sp. CCBAU 11361 TaxID=1630812 RepID=UPI002302ADC9|nr:S8 family peptidase [Bradyrhizobium sp. CCBAU 11361]MDA9488748.1 hypothetical protein [Bradyrhizobium sp. CCBAU 11361]